MEKEIVEIEATAYQWICPLCGSYNHLECYPEEELIRCGNEDCGQEFICDHPIIVR